MSQSQNQSQSQFALLTQRRFAPFFWTQFLGAGNDNIFKFAFTVLATYHAAQWGGLDAKIAGPVIGGLFILPFVLFSATAGQLADKYDRAAIARLVKNFEIAFMVVIAAGFAFAMPVFLFIGVFLMGCHSTLFGPAKFAYLPQHLRNDEQTAASGASQRKGQRWGQNGPGKSRCHREAPYGDFGRAEPARCAWRDCGALTR